MLRAAIKAGTELGLSAKTYMDAGLLVPDEVVVGIVKDHLSTKACENGFILDGFPRTIPQAEALEAMGVKIDVVLSIEVPDETIIHRMSGRMVCHCGASYHVEYIKPQVEGICDKCGKELYVRDDDKAETVANRLKTYHAQTEPLKDFYAERGILKCVEGQDAVEETTALVFEALDGVNA
jgi:adenylate kinase